MSVPTDHADLSTEKALAASAASHMSWANTVDRSARTAPARAALDQKFLDQADGDPVRAASLRKAYFADLTRRSIAARRKAREAAEAEAAVEAEAASLGGGRVA